MKLGFGIAKKIRSVLLLTLALGSIACFGARPYQPVLGDPLLEPWRWRTFPELNGLNAQCVAEGADGKLWFGSVEGVWSYDGFDWIFHSAADIHGGGVSTLCSQTDGSVYVGGRWGISRFSEGEWKGVFPATGRRFGEIRKLIGGRDGSLWAATAWGALHFLQSKWTLYTDPETAARLQQDKGLHFLDIRLLPEAVMTEPRSSSLPANRTDFAEVREDRQGRIWLGTVGGEVLCFDPSLVEARSDADPAAARRVWSIYNESDGLVCGRSPSILPLQDGTIWVVYGAASGHANVFDGVSWKTNRLADAGAPDGGYLLQTRDGVVWLSGRYVLCAYRDGRWRTYQKPEVPIPTALNFIMQSADGALWIAGPNTEIQRVDYQTPRWLTLQDLNFQWESPAGAQWFLHRSGRIVVHEADQWIGYGVEDGLMDAPVALLGTRNGQVWAAGSHEQTAATARFDGEKWTRFIHDEFSWGVEWRGVLESSDGSVWFGAAVDSSGPKQHRDGILQFRDGVWTHHHQPGRSPRNGGEGNPATLLPATQRPEPIGKFLCLGESPDGKIWAGRNILVFQDGRQWDVFSPPQDISVGIIETMFTSRERELWIGTRQSGAVRYDGQSWRQFQSKHSLVANTVRSITQTADSSIWAATDRDVSRFDGRNWTEDLLPAQMSVPHDGGSLKSAPSGALWINRFAPDWTRRSWSKAARVDTATCEFWTICHQFNGAPPETSITAGSEKVARPGNLSVLWTGATPWREFKDSQLQYSFRLDNEPWSDFTSEAGHAFFTLPSGRHRFEVRTRNRDFVVDPTPATLDFVVLPPVWRQTWFLLLMVLLGGLIIAQSIRVLLEQRRLRGTNRVLADEIEVRWVAEEEVRKLNQELEQRVAKRTAQLEVANKELESFSYSVSHDLRAPLRGIDGFSRILLEDYENRLDDDGKDSLRRIRAASQRMGLLIDDLLNLARVSRSEIIRGPVDLSAVARTVADGLRQANPERPMEFVVEPGLVAQGDARLLQIVLENLLGNACKFSDGRPVARIEFGRTTRDGAPAYFVRDNGAGFDLSCAKKIFGAFQRFHSASEFPGTGIGLATVQRIIHRHGGQVSAESQPDHGATFYFALPDQTPPSHEEQTDPTRGRQ